MPQPLRASRRLSLRILRRACWLLAFFPAVALGQAAAAGVTIVVRVADSANAPVADADVSIVQDISAILAHAVTNADGRARLSVPRAKGELQLSVRRIGFQRGYRFFVLPAGDSLSFELRLLRSIATLAPVTVSAAADLKRLSYHLDADDIEHSTRAIIDGTDIFKLRPDMMTSRGGAKACEVPYTQHDGWIESVWINGQRIVMPVVDSTYVAGRKPSLGIAPRLRRPAPRIIQPGAAAQPPRSAPSPFPTFSHIDSVLSILQSVKPEHIAEVTYHDCFDMSVGKNHSEMAMFIVLKPGVGYRDGWGTYVVADEAPAAPGRAPSPLPPYRLRLAGVYDASSGDPLADVEVLDTLSGTSARTTVTGTVSLFFLPEGARPVRLRRDGYADTTFTVTISPADTVPLTLVMTRRAAPPQDDNRSIRPVAGFPESAVSSAAYAFTCRVYFSFTSSVFQSTTCQPSAPSAAASITPSVTVCTPFSSVQRITVSSRCSAPAAASDVHASETAVR